MINFKNIENTIIFIIIQCFYKVDQHNIDRVLTIIVVLTKFG